MTFAYTPAGHWVHEDEPAREYMPLGQEVHTPPEADDVPAPQAAPDKVRATEDGTTRITQSRQEKINDMMIAHQ